MRAAVEFDNVDSRVELDSVNHPSGVQVDQGDGSIFTSSTNELIYSVNLMFAIWKDSNSDCKYYMIGGTFHLPIQVGSKSVLSWSSTVLLKGGNVNSSRPSILIMSQQLMTSPIATDGSKHLPCPQLHSFKVPSLKKWIGPHHEIKERVCWENLTCSR